MARATEQCKALTEDVFSLACERQKAVTDVKSRVAEFLANSAAERRQAFGVTHDRFVGCVEGLAEETHRFLATCNEEQAAVADELRRTADGLRELAASGEAARLDTFHEMHEGIAQMCDDNVQDVAELTAQTRDLLREFEASRQALAEELRGAAEELRQQLADDDNTRLEAFDAVHQRVAGRVADVAREVRHKLEEMHSDSVASRALWNDLAVARARLEKGPGIGAGHRPHAKPAAGTDAVHHGRGRPAPRQPGRTADETDCPTQKKLPLRRDAARRRDHGHPQQPHKHVPAARGRSGKRRAKG